MKADVPTAIGVSEVGGFFPATAGTAGRLTYDFVDPPLIGPRLKRTEGMNPSELRKALVPILVLQVASASVTLPREVVQGVRALFGSVSPTGLALAAWATGGGIRSRELRPVFEDED